MAEAWGNDDFARPEPYGPVVDAAARPRRGLAGVGGRARGDRRRRARRTSPRSTGPRTCALYRRASRQACARDPRAGLLVSMHGQGLYEGRRGLDPGPPPPRAEREPAVQAFLAEQDALQAAPARADRRRTGLDAWAWAGVPAAADLGRCSASTSPGAACRRAARRRCPRCRAPVGDPGVDALACAPTARSGCTCAPWPFRAAARGAAGRRPGWWRTAPTRTVRPAARSRRRRGSGSRSRCARRDPRRTPRLSSSSVLEGDRQAGAVLVDRPVLVDRHVLLARPRRRGGRGGSASRSPRRTAVASSHEVSLVPTISITL